MDALIYLAWFGALGCFVFFAFLQQQSPTSRNLATGQVSRMNSHGYFFYVRAWEQLVFNLGLPSVLAFAVACALVRRKLYGHEGLKPDSELLWLVPFLVLGAVVTYMFWPMSP